MNKKILTVVLAIIMFASVFMGCKKGENDPMSLSSRKARIAGEWTLSEADYQYVYSYSGSSATNSYTYNGTSMTNTYDGDGTTYAYSEKITVEKDGTFTSVITREVTYYDNNYDEQKGTRTTTTEGLWYFVGGNKELEVKNKERVEFMATKETTVNYDGDTEIETYSGRTNYATETLLLDKLAKKEMIILYDASDTSDGDTDSKSGTKTYTQE